MSPIKKTAGTSVLVSLLLSSLSSVSSQGVDPVALSSSSACPAGASARRSWSFGNASEPHSVALAPTAVLAYGYSSVGYFVEAWGGGGGSGYPGYGGDYTYGSGGGGAYVGGYFDLSSLPSATLALVVGGAGSTAAAAGAPPPCASGCSPAPSQSPGCGGGQGAAASIVALAASPVGATAQVLIVAAAGGNGGERGSGSAGAGVGQTAATPDLYCEGNFCDFPGTGASPTGPGVSGCRQGAAPFSMPCYTGATTASGPLPLALPFSSAGGLVSVATGGTCTNACCGNGGGGLFGGGGSWFHSGGGGGSSYIDVGRATPGLTVSSSGSGASAGNAALLPPALAGAGSGSPDAGSAGHPGSAGAVVITECVRPCAAGTFLSAAAGGGCVACPAGAPFSLGGAQNAAQCRAARLAGPADTVFSLYGTAAEVAAGYSVGGGDSGGLTFVSDAFGAAGAALALTPAASLTTAAAQPMLPSGGAARTSSAWLRTTDCAVRLVYIWGATAYGQAWSQLISGNSATAGSSYLWGYNDDWDTQSSVCDGKWHHVAFSIDGLGGTPLGYVDGVPTAGALAHLGTFGAGQFNTPANVVFSISGSAGSISGYGAFSGAIFDVRVYGRALSAAEVLALAQPPLPSFPDAIMVPPAATAGAAAYAWVCAAGFFGNSATLAKSGADNSWSWLGGASAPNCTRCPASAPFSLGGAAAASACSAEAPPSPTDTVFSYSCDASEGLDGFSATAPGGLAFVPNRFGPAASALQLSLGSYLSTITVPAGLASGSVDRALSAWVLCSAGLFWEGNAGAGVLLEYGGFSNLARNGLAVRPAGATALYLVDNSGTDMDSPSVLCDGTWHHAAVILAGGIASIAVDGVITATQAEPLSTPASVVNIGWNGALSWGSGEVFAGVIDDVRVYARALTAAELAALAQPPLAAIPNAAASPSAPTLTATSYAFTCLAGSFGANATLVKNAATNGWAWLDGAPPNCTSCTPSTYSFGGAAACAYCPPGAAFVSATAGCAPATAPKDAAFYLSGTQSEGVGAFPVIAARVGVSFSADRLGNANGALVLASGSYLSAPGALAPAALPRNGNAAFSASAWIKCASISTYAAVLEWGAIGDTSQGATTTAIALTVGAPSAAGAIPLPYSGIVTTLAGSGAQSSVDGTVGTAASFNRPSYIAFVPAIGKFAVSTNGAIRLVTPTSGATSTLVQTAPAGVLYMQGLAVVDLGAADYALVISDITNNNARICTVSSSGAIATLATGFSSPGSLAVAVVDSVTVVFVADNHCVKRIAFSTGAVTDFAGSCDSGGYVDATGSLARFSYPMGLSVMSSGVLVVGEGSGSCRVRLVTPSAVVSTLAGSGTCGFADGVGLSGHSRQQQHRYRRRQQSGHSPHHPARRCDNTGRDCWVLGLCRWLGYKCLFCEPGCSCRNSSDRPDRGC